MATIHDSPHPLLTDPILYLADPPKRIKWYHLEEVFRPCGAISSGGKSTVYGKSNRKRWTVRFSSVYLAEMALATLQGATVTGPNLLPWTMVISHSCTLEAAFPSHRIFPQFVRTDLNGTPGHIGAEEDPQTLFKWFRRAGPLVSVQTDVNVGYPQRAIVVEYWNEEHANLARIKKNALHEDMQHRPAFTLRTYDPHNLYCAGFGATFTHKDFVGAFSEFGPINHVGLKKVGVPDSYGFISFLSRNSAAAALQTMNGKVIGIHAITVRYYEPGAQHIFRSQYSTGATPPSCQGRPSSAQPDSPSGRSTPAHAAQAAERAEAERRREENEMRNRREAAEHSAKEAANAKIKRREEQRLRRKAAERAEAMAREKLQNAIAAEDSAHEGVLAAKSIVATADLELANAEQACAEAKKAWLEAMTKQTGAKKRVADVREDLDEAVRLKLDAEECRRKAEKEELAFRAAREAITKEDEEDWIYEEQEIEEEQEINEESLRQAALAESIRKMEELNKIEKAEKEEREKKDREAALAREEQLKREREAQAREAAERLARERDEAERVAREQREREEKQKRDATNRQHLYQKFAALERLRCLRRDHKFCPTTYVVIWHVQRAHERFLFVSAEFDSIKFQESQPLTFESVPWPVLDHPHRTSWDSIEWGAVEKFFNAIEKLLENQTEYKALLEKAHRRFHPDKWKARGILNSVLDQDLRDRLEAAGNVVAQAITPLWLRTRR